VLGIVYRTIATHLIHKAGYTNIVTPSRRRWTGSIRSLSAN